ncbi:Phospholipid ABC transporter substrate-binding protein MlaD [hydrothermal vent metagenome]|uniref:Phospholipid ABC transporter substrate-binding protein MlaD n=1 Tax=hydrothermal vent metagenome TaxID=652676 RepID=A0A3B0WAX6_9ZZZZ
MTSRKIEILVGFFIAAAIAAFFMLAMSVSNMSSYGSGEQYTIKARFDNVGGLKVRSPVSAGGVRIGRVKDIQYSSETYEAIVSMAIDTQYDKFPLDTAASILTSGLLGEQFVGFEPGAEEEYLKDGDSIDLTQSALVLEQIIGQFLYSQADDKE